MNKFNDRATPDGMMKYKLSIQLYIAFNDANQKDTWTDLNLQQMFRQRMDSIRIYDNSTHKVGRNESLFLGFLKEFLFYFLLK